MEVHCTRGMTRSLWSSNSICKTVFPRVFDLTNRVITSLYSGGAFARLYPVNPRLPCSVRPYSYLYTQPPAPAGSPLGQGGLRAPRTPRTPRCDPAKPLNTTEIIGTSLAGQPPRPREVGQDIENKPPPRSPQEPTNRAVKKALRVCQRFFFFSSHFCPRGVRNFLCGSGSVPQLP
jgi:hypothetical protein